MCKVPFVQRIGLELEKPVDDAFPESACVALAYLLKDLVSRGYVSGWDVVCDEIGRAGRLLDLAGDQNEQVLDVTVRLLALLSWVQIYTFCERVYERLLIPAGHYDRAYEDWVETESLAEVRQYFTVELNEVLAEENLGYGFVNGQFQRRGRPQTQKNIQRIGSVLADPRLSRVRVHFGKALKFFNERPEADAENCVKEAICSLEASVEILASKSASRDFGKALKQLEGNGSGQIPPPIAEGIIKLYAYRGGGQGIAHAALQGSKVSEIEAELVLSIVAAYVTYLYDLFPQAGDSLPF